MYTPDIAVPGFQNPIDLRPSAILGAVWDTVLVEVPVPTTTELLLAFSYTRGAAGGAFDWQVQYSLYATTALTSTGALEWVEEAIYQAGAVASGSDAQSFVQREYQTYEATGANQEGFLLSTQWVGGVERIRVRARESGVVGTPGTLQITAMLR